MKSRPLRMRLLVGAVAALLIAACGDATETSRGKPPAEHELQLQRGQQSLQQSQQQLAAAERRIAAMGSEQTRDRRRIADLAAAAADLERRNQQLQQHLAQARAQLSQNSSVQRALRQQSDQNAQRAHALGREQQAMRVKLASAYNEIHKLQARQMPDQRQIAELYQRGTAAARELDELRRYNGLLLQERSNLQAWLQEAHAARSGQQEALQRSMEEKKRIRSEADAANGRLRAELDKAEQQLAELEATRDRLSRESLSLREAAAKAAADQRGQSERLEKALAHASALAEANERMAMELQNGQGESEVAGQIAGQVTDPGKSSGDVSALQQELHQAGARIEKLQAANAYLVEKVEACSLQQGSSYSGTDGERRVRWPSTGALAARPRLLAVASQDEQQPTSTRHEKELTETKKKVERLEREQQALKKTLQERESECEAVKKQVQTLTWANEVLVKELDAAYANGEPGALPKGTRGIYVLRKGESLSSVAKAFYGNAERWKDIVAANKDKIPDPNRVEAGTVIQIPE
jgi:chromosome segregation ATPase